MKDVQNAPDNRGIPVQKVGIKNLSYPITVRDRYRKSQFTTATVNMFVDLPHRFKGTHMSRFVAILNRYHGMISPLKLRHLLETMVKRFDCEMAHMEIRFPYFVRKEAPVSRAASMMKYDCAFLAAMDCRKKGRFDLVLEAAVPVMTLCPCSREISRYGAHNQRSTVTIRVRSNQLVWLEELIELAESCASSPLFSMLKREDEKQVTETAYDNPRFAEDIVRAVAERLKSDNRVTWFQVESENMESIHNHNAYAMVESKVRNGK